MRNSYKAFFKKCSIEDRKKFKSSKCILPISVGQNLHEGDKFRATIELIDRSFEKCIILIDDVVQRHTMKIMYPDKNIKELYTFALRDGDLWIERNENIYSILNIPFKIMRWENFYLHEKYIKQRDIIDLKYEQDKNYRNAFKLSIKIFLDRYQKHNGQMSESHYGEAHELCLEYLKEECACMCLWTEEKCDFEVYPSGRNVAMQHTYELLIKPLYPNLLKSVSLYFKKDKKINGIKPSFLNIKELCVI